MVFRFLQATDVLSSERKTRNLRACDDDSILQALALQALTKESRHFDQHGPFPLQYSFGEQWSFEHHRMRMRCERNVLWLDVEPNIFPESQVSVPEMDLVAAGGREQISPRQRGVSHPAKLTVLGVWLGLCLLALKLSTSQGLHLERGLVKVSSSQHFGMTK